MLGWGHGSWVLCVVSGGNLHAPHHLRCSPTRHVFLGGDVACFVVWAVHGDPPPRFHPLRAHHHVILHYCLHHLDGEVLYVCGNDGFFWIWICKINSKNNFLFITCRRHYLNDCMLFDSNIISMVTNLIKTTYISCQINVDQNLAYITHRNISLWTPITTLELHFLYVHKVCTIMQDILYGLANCLYRKVLLFTQHTTQWYILPAPLARFVISRFLPIFSILSTVFLGVPPLSVGSPSSTSTTEPSESASSSTEPTINVKCNLFLK